MFWKKNIWIKYAGSWDDSSSPITYKLQRWYLKQFQRNVKISLNGNYPELGKNFYKFINPCFNQKTLDEAKEIARKKTFKGRLNLLFVGRLEKEKGLDDLFRLIEYKNNRKNIQSLTIIGESKYQKKYLDWASNITLDIQFCGSLPRHEVFKYYSNSQILILLSKSEGFPKVIMEAGAFGCVPIISDLKEIKYVIKDNINGFILKNDSNHINKRFSKVLSDSESLKFCSKNISKESEKYTFENYLKLLKNALLH